MDPREAMILNLKKRVDILTNENTHLRNLLKKDDNNQTTTTGSSIVQAQVQPPIAPIRSGPRKISAKSNSDYDIQDDLGDTQSIRFVSYVHLRISRKKSGYLFDFFSGFFSLFFYCTNNLDFLSEQNFSKINQKISGFLFLHRNR